MGTLTRELTLEKPMGLYLDEAVEEVFSLMMSVSCLPVEEIPCDESETITAVIGLAGALSGACILRSGEKVALRMAELLVGTEIAGLDDTVKDAIGEVCNMLAGAWKGKIAAYASECMLSVPAVVSGSQYKLHLQKPKFRLDHVYRFENFAFSLSLICDSVQ